MTNQNTTDLIEKIRTVHLSRRGLVGAAAAATLAARQGWDAHSPGQSAGHLRRGVFDSGGATLRVGSWGGFWEEMERKYLLDQFAAGLQLHQSSTTQPGPGSRSSSPAASTIHPSTSPTGTCLSCIRRRRRARPRAASSCRSKSCKPTFRTAPTSGTSPTSSATVITYLFSQLGYGYRTDQGDPPTDFKSFWEERYADKRGTYITSNTLQMIFFIVASARLRLGRAGHPGWHRGDANGDADEDQRLHRQHADPARTRRGRHLRPA